MIGIIGGTGTIGHYLVADLQKKNVPLTCLVRAPSKAAIAASRTTRVVEADLDRPETLLAGLAGCRSLFLLTGPHPHLSSQQIAAVQAAQEAGVGHVVKLSAGDPVVSETAASQIGREHWHAEQYLKSSGLDWTMLRPGFFMQNFLAMAAGIRSRRSLAMPVPAHMTVAMIDAQDIATAAAAALLDGAYTGTTVPLAGESYLMSDFPILLSHFLGTPVVYEHVPLETAVAGMKAAGMPDWMVSQQREVLRLMAVGAFSAGNGPATGVIGRERRTLTDFTRAALEHFRPDGADA